MTFLESLQEKEMQRRKRAAAFFRAKATLRKVKSRGLPLLTATELQRQLESGRQRELFT